MDLTTIIKQWAPDALLEFLRHLYKHETNEKFRFGFDDVSDVKLDIQKKYSHNSELLDIFVNNRGYVVNKWHHYIPLYDRYFSSFRGQKIKFLEIGVSQGGSLQMWRKYLGNDAIIYGIDINPACKQFNGLAGQVRIGSQTDKRFLESVIQEMGGIDIVLDDGSHHMKHISTTLEYLFPHLRYGGIYMIEDLHTAYWNTFGGGYRAKTNFFGLLMDVVDDIHRWYHTKEMKRAAISKDCSGIHIHDSIVVLEKNKVYQPAHSHIG